MSQRIPIKNKNSLNSNSQGKVLSVCKKSEPGLPKFETSQIVLLDDFGVKGDYHAGKFIRHRWLADMEPTRYNNRQVLLVDDEILADIAREGISIQPGDLGENILIEGINLMKLSIGTHIYIGEIELELTEIRKPCYQLDEIHPGLQDVVMPEKENESTWNAGMLAIVVNGGFVKPGDLVSLKHVK